jgi:hypothetical protein
MTCKTLGETYGGHTEMSQRAVERVVGKLVTDEGFRNQFFADPEGASVRVGAELSPDELDALTRIPPDALTSLCASIDDRICRLHITPQPTFEERRR